MTEEPRSALDVEELEHLALRALSADREDDAIRWLKDALALAPDRARLHHLLGVAHFRIGLNERAAEEIGRALELDPGLVHARFQLGMLAFMGHEHERANAVWQPLHDSLEAEHPLRLYASGVSQLGRGEFEASIATLEQGAQRCDNPRLGDEMRGFADAARRHLAGGAAPAVQAGNGRQPADDAAQHLLVSRYEQSRGSGGQ